jgi:Sulfotransferase family
VLPNNGGRQVPPPGRNFVFIAGAEGSGTTLLLRFVSSPDCCAALGGNYLKLPDHPEASRLTNNFVSANARLWNRKLSWEEHENSRADWRAAMGAILAAPAFAETSTYVFKRSFPFAQPRDRFTPDLWDVIDFWPGARILVIFRDPRASTYSAFRRKFDSDLRRLAVVCSEQLTWLTAQVRAIGLEHVLVISYSKLCAKPWAVLGPVANFCAIPRDKFNQAAHGQDMDGYADLRWRRELSRRDSEWLDQFFDERRRRQWDLLEPGCN